jgi:hypothetical protein
MMEIGTFIHALSLNRGTDGSELMERPPKGSSGKTEEKNRNCRPSSPLVSSISLWLQITFGAQ